MYQRERKNKYINLSAQLVDNSDLPPQELELEQAVLGAVMLDSSLSDKVMADFVPNIFYKETHRLIAESIVELYKKGSPIDILTVTQHLKAKDELRLVGGAVYIAQLTNRIASSANAEFHIKILQEQSLKRSMLAICSQAMKSAFEDGTDVFDLYSETQSAIDDSMKSVLHYEIQSIGAIHQDNLDESREVLNNGGLAGVTTGLTEVDRLTNGWMKSDLIILAGRPGMGKTASAICMAIQPSISKGIPVAIFSLEMSKKQLVGRAESMLSGVNVSRIIKKQLDDKDINTIQERCAVFKKSPIFIDDTPNISLIELKSKVRRLVREKGVELVVIDYLQLMRSGLNIGNREQEIAEISRGLKALAKELDIPIIALSQLSRIVESRNDKKPMLSDLRESGQIEQDADMVIFCYRPEYYGIESYELAGETYNAKGLFIFIVAKHRNGELGEIPLNFIHEQTKIVDFSHFGSNEELGSKESYTAPVGVVEEKKEIEQSTLSILNDQRTEEDLF